MKPWLRDNTKDWIHSVESRIEDLDYYLKRTVEYCERTSIWEDKKVFLLSVITCVWVTSMRDESITLQEIVEILGLEQIEYIKDDRIFDISENFQNLDHEQLLDFCSSKLGNWDDYFPS